MMKKLGMLFGALVLAPVLAIAAPPGYQKADQFHAGPTAGVYDPLRDLSCNAGGGESALLVGAVVLGLTVRRRR